MKTRNTVTVTEQDVREALGSPSGYSPLADRLIYNLFGHQFEKTISLENRMSAMEKKIKALSKRKNK